MLSSRRRQFCLVGIALAITMSTGLLLVRALGDEDPLDWPWIVRELSDEPLTYGYVMGTTFLAGLVLGWLMGNKTDQLQIMALTDPLTGLANRRGFMAVLDDELQRAIRYQTPLTVMLVDVDYLKQINDGFGHEAGDAALRRVAESLRTYCRASDLPARFGGDEFVLVLPSTGALEAQELANRIRHWLAVPARTAQGNSSLSVSIGITDLQRAGTVHGDALVAAADAALYQAKSEGRDRVVVSPEPSASTRHMAQR